MHYLSPIFFSGLKGFRLALLIALITCYGSSEGAQLDSLQSVLDTIQDGPDKGAIYQALFDYYYDHENDSALVTAQLHYDLAKELGDQEMLVYAFINLGLYYDLYQSNFEESIKNYQEAYKIADSLQMPVIKEIANHMGVVFHQTDDYERAKSYYQEAVEQSEKYGDLYRKTAARINIASIHSSQGQYETAATIFKQILDDEASDDPYLRSMARSNLANMYIRMGSYEQAIPLILETYHYDEEGKSYRGAIQALDYLVEAKIGINNLEGMDTIIQLTRQLVDSTSNLRVISLGYESISEAYSAMGDYKNAYLTKMTHMHVYDSMKNAQREELVYELDTRYQSEKQQNEINQLKIQSQEAELAAQRRRIQLYAFVFTSSIFLMLVIFYVIRYRQKHKINQQLSEKNAVIEAALKERETLLKEIHHRVKNNLQVVSSLLSLQAGSLSDEAAIDAVKQGQFRVRSMALIHQKLYQENDLKGVTVQDYLENLLRELINSFGLTNREVDYDIETHGLKLDVDTLVPLGLIINELITNSLKYAFQDMEQGVLSIEMKEAANQLHVSVKDNGRGFDQDKLVSSNSFGWTMIKSLARKLKAEINIGNQHGTTVELIISRYKLAV